jgi:putative ABC transport system substrate-binding protein
MRNKVRRRLLAVLLATPLAALAQRAPRVARVALLTTGTEDTFAPQRSVLIGALKGLGWVEGRTLAVNYRHAGTRPEDLPDIAADVVREQPDVIVCQGPAPAVALKDTGTAIPVVFVVVADPVGLKLAASLGRPGGNFTGLSTMVPDTFLQKQLELLRETVPDASRVAFLTNPGNPVHRIGRELRLKAASMNGWTPIELQAATLEQLERAFGEAIRQKADVMYLSGDPLPLTNRRRVAELAIQYRLPVMFLFRQHVEAGGLMSYGSDTADLFRRAAGFVDRILRGAKPADLPIEQPTKFELTLNQGAARAIGLTFPQQLLLRADRVIE